MVVDGEADVVNGDINLPARRLAQQARRAQRPRVAGAQDLLQVGERQPGVDDVLDDQHVLAVERRVQVLQQPDFTGTRRPLRVAGHGHEVHRDAAVHEADQVRHEHERALQHRDDVQILRVVGPDLGGQFGHTALELFGGNEDVGRATVDHRSGMILLGSS